MGVASLREASLAPVENSHLEDVSRRRALHVIGESDRVLRGVQALGANQLEAFGEPMFASHFSSRVNFENSTSHLDTLVDLARQTAGVFGSRLTGGGFGGSTVSLVETARADEIVRKISSEYYRKTDATCSPTLTEPSEGARIL